MTMIQQLPNEWELAEETQTCICILCDNMFKHRNIILISRCSDDALTPGMFFSYACLKLNRCAIIPSHMYPVLQNFTDVAVCLPSRRAGDHDPFW